MPGATLKVTPHTRERLKVLAGRSHRSMSSVIDEALDCYERTFFEADYLAGWARFQREDPDGFTEYQQESSEIVRGLSDTVHG